jgi:hypothetical protein
MEGRKGQNYEQDCVEGVYVETDSTKKETNGSKEKAKLTNKTSNKLLTLFPRLLIELRRLVCLLALPFPTFPFEPEPEPALSSLSDRSRDGEREPPSSPSRIYLLIPFHRRCPSMSWLVSLI